jgi:hypothetical protein
LIRKRTRIDPDLVLLKRIVRISPRGLEPGKCSEEFPRRVGNAVHWIRKNDKTHCIKNGRKAIAEMEMILYLLNLEAIEIKIVKFLPICTQFIEYQKG